MKNAPKNAANEYRPGDTLTIDQQTYRLDSKLDRTILNRVYLGSAPDGEKVVVKVATLDGLMSVNRRESYRLSQLYPDVLRQAKLPRMRYSDDQYTVADYVPGLALSAYSSITRSRLHALMTSLSPHIDTLRRHDLVHRDLKPSNIIIKGPLSDFHPETVRVIDHDLLTQVLKNNYTSDEVFGTPYYIPPEYCLGNLHRNNDVYALGMVGFALFPAVHHPSIYYDPEVKRSGTDVMLSKYQKRFFLPNARQKLEVSILSKSHAIDDERRTVRSLLNFLFACVKDSPNARPATLAEMQQMLDDTGNILEI